MSVHVLQVRPFFSLQHEIKDAKKHSGNVGFDSSLRSEPVYIVTGVDTKMQ